MRDGKGALTGVAEATIAAMEKLGARRARIRAAIGPLIRQPNYEVGAEFVDRFTAADAAYAKFFVPAARPGHAMFDLPGFIRSRLERAGIAGIEDWLCAPMRSRRASSATAVPRIAASRTTDVTSMRLHWCNKRDWTRRRIWRYPKRLRLTRESREGGMTARTGSQGGVTGGQELAARAGAHCCRRGVPPRSVACARPAAARPHRPTPPSRLGASGPDHRVRFDRRPAGRRVQPAGRQPLRRGAGRQLALASREGAANYRVRGYLAAQVIRGRTQSPGCWDVYDDDKLRACASPAREAGGRAGADPWSVADEAMLRRIARAEHGAAREFRGESCRPGCGSGNRGRRRARAGPPAAA
jgi:hypothetical protein